MTAATGNEGKAARATVQRLIDKHGYEGHEAVMQWASQRKHHAHPDGPLLIDVLEERNQRYASVLEIGTARGMSALILAHWADVVHTIDIYHSKWIPEIFIEAGVEGRVVPIVVADDKEKAKVIQELTFEMANLDGDHTRAAVQLDFDLAKRCGLLLFHDYPQAYPGADGVGWVLGRQKDGIVIDRTPFAWWEAR